MSIEKQFQLIVNKIFSNQLPKKIAVAVSGGIDSMALILLLEKTFQKKNIKIFCLTVDHKTRKNSGKDAQFVADFCQKQNINCTILTSNLKTPPQANIESALREVRYNLLSEFCRNNKVNHLFVAHHRQDLAENFLIRLFRGSGIDGLAALDYQNQQFDINVIRPLLDFSKDDLKKYLQDSRVKWVEDESNEDEKYLRNKIRKFLHSLPDHDLINGRIATASQSILESKKIITNYLQKNADDILQFNQLGYFILNIKNFKSLIAEEALRYLAWCLMDVSGNFYKPRKEGLQKIYQLILDDKVNQAHTFYGSVLERLNNQEIIIYREISEHSLKLSASQLTWDERFIIKADKKLLKENITITNFNSTKFNNFVKTHKLPNYKNPLKKVFYTLPVFKVDDKIIAIPHLNYYSNHYSNGNLAKQITITFKSNSPLLKNAN